MVVFLNFILRVSFILLFNFFGLFFLLTGGLAVIEFFLTPWRTQFNKQLDRGSVMDTPKMNASNFLVKRIGSIKAKAMQVIPVGNMHLSHNSSKRSMAIKNRDIPLIRAVQSTVEEAISNSHLSNKEVTTT